MNSLIKKFIPILCIIPFIAGTVGYVMSGEALNNSLYASFALYFTNPVSDAYNGFVEFARWTAPLVMVTAILYALGTVWKNITYWAKCLSKDSVAVYSDEEIRVRFDKSVKAIYPGESFKGFAKSHILLFSSDQKSLIFFEENKKKLKRKAVYIGLRELETGLIKENDNAVLFDINGAIARSLWKEIKLWNSGKEDIRIVLYGNSLLAQNILNYGLLMNLLSKKQKVSYHVISEKPQFQIKHPGFLFHNKDEIVYHSDLDRDAWRFIQTADIVIIADVVSVDMLQTFLVNTAAGKMYYYSPGAGDAGDYIAFKSPTAFGRDEHILTDENIRRQKLVQTAIMLHKEYAEKNGGEKDWNKLSGFLKNSNISAADFNEVLAALPASMPEEDLAELEHIRWCRFHYLNYWKKGTPADGKNKDAEERIHKDLVSYDDLDPEEKEKDRAIVKMARKNIHIDSAEVK